MPAHPRVFPCISLVLGRLFGVCVLACATALPAAASPELVDQGIGQAKAGKTREAVRTLTDALETPNLPRPLAARAYYGRGLAYEASQRPAQAIADFTAALWLGALKGDEASDAATRRLAAFGAAGVPPSPLAGTAPPATGAAAPTPGSAAPLAMAALPLRKTKEPIRYIPRVRTAAATPVATSQSGGNSGASWYSGLTSLFGGSNNSAARAPAVAQPAVAQRTARARQDAPAAAAAFNRDDGPFGETFPVGSQVRSPVRSQARSAPPVNRTPAPAAPATPSRTAAISAEQTAAVTPAAAPRQTAARATAAATTATRVSASDFNLQVATLKARDRAQSYAAELMIKHAGIIGNAQADVDQTLVAGRGTRYRVRLGPFPSRQTSLNACKKLKGVGVDCFLIR